jgi:hypothetical protein
LNAVPFAAHLMTDAPNIARSPLGSVEPDES